FTTIHSRESDMRPSRRHVVFFGSIRTDSSARRTSHSASSLLAFARGFMPALLVAAAAFGAVIPGSDGETGPNSDPNYLALRNITLGSEAVSVTNFDLKRDAGTFHLHSGTVCFVPPVNGRVTGAVFAGDGSFVLNPPTEAERKSLKYLTKEDQFNEKFERSEERRVGKSVELGGRSISKKKKVRKEKKAACRRR